MKIAQLESRSQAYKRITEGLRNFINHSVGAWKLVQEAKRLEIWKEKWSSWQEYCEKELGTTKQRAYQLLEVAGAIEDIQGVKPFDSESGKNKEILANLTSRQATALKGLSPETKAQVFHKAVAVSGGKSPKPETIANVRRSSFDPDSKPRDHSNDYLSGNGAPHGTEKDFPASEPRVHTTLEDTALAYEFAGYPKTIQVKVCNEQEESDVRKLMADFADRHGETEKASSTPARDLIRKLTGAYKELTGKTLLVTGADAAQVKRLIQMNGVTCTDEIVLTFKQACQAKGFFARQSHQLATFVKHYGNIRHEITGQKGNGQPAPVKGSTPVGGF